MRKKGLMLCIAVLLMLNCIACGQQTVQGEQETEHMPDIGVEVTVENTENTTTLVDDSFVTNNEASEGLKCIVQVQTDNQRGSGVLWDKQEKLWIFVTAAHVVGNLEQVELYFVEEDKMCPAQVHLVEGLDLAFLQVDIMQIPDAVQNAYGDCSIVSAEIKRGDMILATGYDAAAEKLEYAGSVLEPWIYTEDFENYMLMCQCEAWPGMSGGAVFTVGEELLGIVCGQNEAGLLAVLPVAVIEGEYSLFINY